LASEAEILDVRGSGRKPFSTEEVVSKFRRNAVRLMAADTVDTVVEAVLSLDSAASLDTLATAPRAVTPARD